MSAQDDVRTASDQFYAALNSMVNGDARPMADIWSHADTVTTMHPIGGRQVGWADVKTSWAGVADLSTRGSVALTDQQIRVMGDVAYEVGVEHVDMTLAGDRFQGEVRVTNIYHRKQGEWHLIHHHSDTSPAMQDLLRRAQAA